MTAVLVAIGVVSIVALVVIVVAPWRSVRDEPRLADDTETELLLRIDPDTLAPDTLDPDTREPGAGDTSRSDPIEPLSGEG